MDPGTEARLRREGARFIIDIGSSMNLSLTTMATGVVFFHRFFMVRLFQDFPHYVSDFNYSPVNFKQIIFECVYI
jgi:hypothetical protein